jgi:cytochrome c-type biogenesis protein CcmH
MGWLVALVLAAGCFTALWRSGRIPRLGLELAAAMILAGLAGYAWQGSPGVPGKPVSNTTSASRP